MRAADDLAVAAIRSWVALYTLGLSDEVRSGRRLEIDSDVWEQRQLDEYECRPLFGSAPALVTRCVRGVFSDISWRVQEGLLARSERSLRVHEPLRLRALVLLALAVAAFPIVIGFLVIIGVNGELTPTERATFGPLSILVGGTIVAGLALSGARPVLGIGLVAVGTVAISALWLWMFFITIPVGIVIGAIAFVRARQRGWRWPEGAGTA